MAEIRRPVEFTALPDEGHAMLTPFGPHVVYSRMPSKIVRSLNKYVDLKLEKGRAKKLDHSKNLVGKVSQ